jgi:hypothetical protein
MTKPKKEDFNSWSAYHAAREIWERKKQVKLFCTIWGANLVLIGSLITLMLLNR